MKNKDQILTDILNAREQRADLRKEFFALKRHSISLCLNVPGYPKSNSVYLEFFNLILEELKIYLQANRIFISSEKVIEDDAGSFFIAGLEEARLSVKQIKLITEKFEESHLLGRFIDVDIFDNEGNPVSSGKAKMCFYCEEQSAVLCMREERHSFDEVRVFQHQKIKQYLESESKESSIQELITNALRAILYEISLTPKPGLVDANDAGIHNDMNYQTFIDSTAEISTLFYDMANLGYSTIPAEELLVEIRRVGLKMEKRMFERTGNVNTQKGVIFLMGNCLAAAARCYYEKGCFKEDVFVSTIKMINQNIENEFVEVSSETTHGEQCFDKYGMKAGGVRKEISLGLPAVFEHGLPFLERFEQDELKFSNSNSNEVLQRLLMLLISKVNDTNIIFRHGIEVLDVVQNMAIECFLSDENFSDKYQEINDYFQNNRISPGGSADLLSITLFLYFIKKTTKKCK
jgi:holo-ACP synthase/triphosphoribosyl-dephospho-CoA synthase